MRLFTTMLNNYLIYFYQPTAASSLPTLITQGYVFTGVLTVIGLIKALGHIIDAVSDPMAAALKHAFSNRHFCIVTLGQLFEGTGMSFFHTCIMYYITELIDIPEEQSIIIATSILASLVLCLIINKWSKRFGQKIPIIVGCVVFAAAKSFVTRMGASIVTMIVPSLIMAEAVTGQSVGRRGLLLSDPVHPALSPTANTL